MELIDLKTTTRDWLCIADANFYFVCNTKSVLRRNIRQKSPKRNLEKFVQNFCPNSEDKVTFQTLKVFKVDSIKNVCASIR